MSNFSNYVEAAGINWLLRGIAPPVPTGVFIGLLSAVPTDDNATAVELQADGGTSPMPSYRRVNAAGSGALTSAWTEPIDGWSYNRNVITFPASTAGAAIVIAGVGIFDAPLGGNLLFHTALATTTVLDPGDVYVLPAGEINVTLD